MIPHFVLAGAGVWLMAAPAVLGYGDPAATSDRIAGPALAAIGYLSAYAILRGLRWLNLITGAWLVAAPWLLGFPTDATVNSMLVGVLTLALAWTGKVSDTRFGGGWSAVRRQNARPT